MTASDEGVVLRILPYGESDAVVGLFTEHHGRISAFARGARRSQKRFGGALDLFTELRLELSSGLRSRSALWRLDRVELREAHIELRRNLGRLAQAEYLAECLWSFAPEGEAQTALYAWWKGALRRLCEASDPRAIAHELDLELLSHSGYAPHWQSCTECGRGVPAGRFFFSFEKGGAICTECRPRGEGRWLEPQDRVSVQGAVSAYVSYTLGKEPRSQRFREEVFRDGE